MRVPLMMLTEVEVPLVGPQTSWKSVPASQVNSLGACSPLTMNVMLNCSFTPTRLGAWTLTEVWADAASARQRAATIAMILRITNSFLSGGT